MGFETFDVFFTIFLIIFIIIFAFSIITAIVRFVRTIKGKNKGNENPHVDPFISGQNKASAYEKRVVTFCPSCYAKIDSATATKCKICGVEYICPRCGKCKNSVNHPPTIN